MANGIYTQPIPVRDINEDIRYLGEVLARNAALRQKSDQAKIKALNDAKARSAKSLYDQFKYDIDAIPKHMRQPFEDFKSAQQQKFLDYSNAGDLMGAKEVLDRYANVYGEMVGHKASFIDPYKEATEIIAQGIDVSSEKNLVAGLKYSKQHYNTDNIIGVADRTMEGGQYAMKYDLPSDTFSILNQEGTTQYIKNINQIWGYSDSSPLVGGQIEVSIIPDTAWTNIDGLGSEYKQFGDESVAKAVDEVLSRSKDQLTEEEFVAEAKKIGDAKMDNLFGASQRVGAQFRLSAIARYGDKLSDEDVKLISEGVKPEDYAKQTDADSAKLYEETYNKVKNNYKDVLNDLISTKIDYKTYISGGKKETKAERDADAFIESIQWDNKPLESGEEGIQASYALSWKEEDNWVVADPKDKKKNVRNASNVQLEFTKDGKRVNSITLSGGYEADVAGPLTAYTTPIILKPSDGEDFFNTLQKIIIKTNEESGSNLTETLRKAKDYQRNIDPQLYWVLEYYNPPNFSNVPNLKSNNTGL